MTLTMHGMKVRVEYDDKGMPYLNAHDLQLAQQSGHPATFAEEREVRDFFAEALREKGLQ
jgi:hypothetical protein